MSPNARDELAALGLDGGPRQPNNANYPGHKGNKQKRTRHDHRGTNQGNGVYTKLRTLPLWSRPLSLAEPTKGVHRRRTLPATVAFSEQVQERPCVAPVRRRCSLFPTSHRPCDLR